MFQLAQVNLKHGSDGDIRKIDLIRLFVSFKCSKEKLKGHGPSVDSMCY